MSNTLEANNVVVQADTVSGSPQTHLIFKGNVQLERKTELPEEALQINAPLIDVCMNTNSVEAQHGVQIKQGHNRVIANKIQLNTLTQTGVAHDLNYYFDKTQGYGHAQQLTIEPIQVLENPQNNSDHPVFKPLILSDNLKVLDKASYTTCLPYSFKDSDSFFNKEPINNIDNNIDNNVNHFNSQEINADWLLKADRLILNETTQTGYAKTMSLRFKNIPLLSLPYFEFPLSSKRRSGFLTPNVGYNTVSGIDLSVPYYLNLADNYDATLTPRYMTRRGVQLTASGRYLTPSFKGNVKIDALPYDNLIKMQRWGISTQHSFEVVKKETLLSGGLTLHRVSDNRFLADLSKNTTLAADTHLPTELWGRYQTSWGTLFAQASDYQTLQNAENTIITPYRRLPSIGLTLKPIQLGLNILKNNINNINNINLSNHRLTFNLSGQMTRFTHPTLTQGVRTYVLPQLNYQYTPMWGFVKAKLQWNMAHYNRLQGETYQGNSEWNRAIPMFSLDTGLTFERQTTLFSWLNPLKQSILHTLEPRLYFVYVPFKDQSKVPVFDSAESTFNLNQIFSDNVFTGQDRIANALHFTPALTTHWINAKDGTSLLKATLGKRYYFEPQRVRLTGDSLPPKQGSSIDSSDWLLAVSGQPISALSFDAAFQYNQTNSHVVNSRYTVHYKHAPQRLISLSRRFSQQTDNLHNALDIAWQWKVKPEHAIIGKLSYSLGLNGLNTRGLTESLLGYEYDTGCWSFRIAGNRYINTANVKTTSFYIQLNLSGLTQVKSGSLDTLTRTLPAYTPFKRSLNMD